METRRNPITGDPAIFAPERARRPNDFAATGAACPFCPGHEHETPPEILRAGNPWRIRVFPNKYPFAPHHEVIVESAEHEARFEDLSNAGEIVSVYAGRIDALLQQPRVQHVVFFRNHGMKGGASLRHLHSQIAAVEFVPPRIAREAEAFRSASQCPICSVAGFEVAEDNGVFRALVPHARSFARELWIAPSHHQNHFASIPADACDALGSILRRAAARTSAGGADYNWMLLDFPAEPRGHWYLQLAARNAAVAGFELATGTFIDTAHEGDGCSL